MGRMQVFTGHERRHEDKILPPGKYLVCASSSSFWGNDYVTVVADAPVLLRQVYRLDSVSETGEVKWREYNLQFVPWHARLVYWIREKYRGHNRPRLPAARVIKEGS